MSAPVVPPARPTVPPATDIDRRRDARHRTLLDVASLVFFVPTSLFLLLVFFVEEWPVQLWVMLELIIATAILLLARRRPILGGIMVALFGIANEVPWFMDQLGGDVETLLGTLDSPSPAWVAVPCLVAGALFIAIGVQTRSARPS